MSSFCLWYSDYTPVKTEVFYIISLVLTALKYNYRITYKKIDFFMEVFPNTQDNTQ